MKKSKKVLKTVKDFKKSVDFRTLKSCISEAIINGVKTSKQTPSDTKHLHHLYSFIEDIEDSPI